MSRLVIHIGTHKTATTRLQKLFRRNRDLLARHGVIFPQVAQTDGQHGLVSIWNALLLPEPDFDARAAWADLAARHAAGSQTVFVSSEEFSRMSRRRVNMAELADLTAAFDEVHLICTLRNQAAFLQSIYLQISSSRPPADWDAFFDRMLATGMADGLMLNYDRLYTHLLGGFARNRIHLISYDHAILQPGGIVGAYLRALDVPLAPEDLVPVTDSEANISPDPLATFVACTLGRPDPPGAGQTALVQGVLAQAFGAGRRSCLLTRHEVARMAAVFDPLNAALSARIAPYQPDFRLGDMLGRGADLYREDLTPALWADMAAVLARDRALHGPAPRPEGTPPGLAQRIWRRILGICLG